jgi:hypothetical protein
MEQLAAGLWDLLSQVRRGAGWCCPGCKSQRICRFFLIFWDPSVNPSHGAGQGLCLARASGIFSIQPIQIGGERLSSQSSAGEGRWGHVNVKRLQHLQHSIGGLAILIRLLQLLHRLLQTGFQFLGGGAAS